MATLVAMVKNDFYHIIGEVTVKLFHTYTSELLEDEAQRRAENLRQEKNKIDAAEATNAALLNETSLTHSS